MRDIKFRGKRTDNGEWVFGFFYLGDEIADGNTSYIAEFDGRYHIDEHEVDPETVGQFTDILARGEVYNGTILHFPNMEEYVDVFYNEGAFWVLFENDNESTLLTQKLLEANYATVAGNIHDNPELLEQGDS